MIFTGTASKLAFKSDQWEIQLALSYKVPPLDDILQWSEEGEIPKDKPCIFFRGKRFWQKESLSNKWNSLDWLKIF